jgi:hypothetical protein
MCETLDILVIEPLAPITKVVIQSRLVAQGYLFVTDG